MKGFPKTLKTRQDILNCKAMVDAGVFKASDLQKAMNKLEATNYIVLQINGLSEDRKTVTTNYCAEAAAGGTAVAGNVKASIKSVTHNEETNEETGQTNNVSSDIVLSKAIAASSETLKVLKATTCFDRLNMTEEEFDSILADLEA